MFQRCKLVHGDFSEYNLLWHKSRIYVIDVSQSVGTDHPAALDFLRKDASNVNDYFSKVGKLDVMTTRQLFDFVTTVIDGGEKEEMEFLEKTMHEVEASYKYRSKQCEQEQLEQNQQESVDEAVFMSSFLPRSLNQVADYDIKQLESGKVEESYAIAVAALTGNKDVVDKYKAYKQGEGLENPDEEPDEQSDREDDSDDSESESEEEERFQKIPKTQEQLAAEKVELRASRKANKKEVKEAKIEQRKKKIKKKDKKRAINKAKAGNQRHK
jgi:RIO kinase 1